MLAWVLPDQRRGLSLALPFLVAMLGVVSWSPCTDAGEPLPDVVVSAVTLTPGTVRAGDPVTATVTLLNQGGSPAEASQVSLHLGNSSGIPLTGILPLATLAFDALAPGSSQQISSSFIVPSVPTGSVLGRGGRRWSSLVAESSETNNRRTAGLRVTIADLTVSRLTLTPSIARVGDTVTATAVIVNAGRVPADTSAVRLHFETASSVPPTGVGSALAGPLAARESREVSFRFTVPAVPSQRRYSAWVQVDPDGHLPETNERNNRRDAWLQVAVPDLTVEGLSMTPNPARAGDWSLCPFESATRVLSPPTPARQPLRRDRFPRHARRHLRVDNERHAPAGAGQGSVAGIHDDPAGALRGSLPASSPWSMAPASGRDLEDQ